MGSRRRSPGSLALALLPLVLLAACKTDTSYVARDRPGQEGLPPIRVVRTGVPVLMDLPVVGILFSRSTISR